jgi:hypothetical protein
VNTYRAAYNFGMHSQIRRRPGKFLRRPVIAAAAVVIGWALFAVPALAQQSPPSGALAITTKELPAASLWSPYTFRLQAGSGTEPYHWRVVSGSLPGKLELRASGEIAGAVEEQGAFEFTAQATGRSPERSVSKKLALDVETPLKIDWSRRAQVNGNRIEGSIKVSNTTGRDFDLTFVVLAVNESGRATAIGYQRFPLKTNTRDMELPFGETLPPGSYAVNIDVVGEEPQSKMIFRSRLVDPKQTIAPVL